MNSNYARSSQARSLSVPLQPTSRVVIVGGGASGALMALHLARKSLEIEVILVEKADSIGQGLAYGTTCPEHVVNVVPYRLSAFDDDPTHFVRWLRRRHEMIPDDHFVFVQRRLVGDYIREMLEAAGPNLTIVKDEVTALKQTGAGVEVSLKSSHPFSADSAILATGHDWIRHVPGPEAVPADAAVTILGTGLSMVDRLLSLRAAGHRGHITAISRRGLLPHPHAPCVSVELDPSMVPTGRPVSEVLRWARDLARTQVDWRSAVDAIRPFAARLWQGWTIEQQRRFLRHARPYWDIHRHRLAPSVHARLAAERRAGTLRVERSRAPVNAAFLFDCRGLHPAWDEIGDTLIGHLLRWGDIRIDPLGLSLEVTDACELIAADGRPSTSLYAIGPLTRGRFWEIDALPEIRSQCEFLASRLVSQLARHHAIRS